MARVGFVMAVYSNSQAAVVFAISSEAYYHDLIGSFGAPMSRMF